MVTRDANPYKFNDLFKGLLQVIQVKYWQMSDISTFTSRDDILLNIDTSESLLLVIWVE